MNILLFGVHGVRSKTATYRWSYRLSRPLLRRLMPTAVLQAADISMVARGRSA